MFKKLLAILLVLSTIFSLSACSQKEPTTLDFYNYNNTDLFRLINDEVIIYGYFLLNPAQNNVAYIAEMPYRGISNEQTSGDISYAKLDMQKNGVIAVSFKETPKYTSMPVKITGKIEAGPFTDAYYFSYNYRIKDATYEIVDFSYLDATLQTYYNLAKNGYLDAIYTGILNVEVALTENQETFPTFKNYENIKKELEAKTRNTMEEEYLTMLNNLNDIYTRYSSVYGTDKFDKDRLTTDIEDFYNGFNIFLTAYAGIAPTGAVPN